MHQLDIYIEQNCLGCDYAKVLASEIRQLFPQLEVRIYDLTRPDISKPKSIFAVPTYILDNTTISLGNPDKRKFVKRLWEILN